MYMAKLSDESFNCSRVMVYYIQLYSPLSICMGDLQSVIKGSFKYHKSLLLFERACELDYPNSLKYINIKEKRTSDWFVKFTCIYYRYNKRSLLEVMPGNQVLTMINVMKKRDNPELDEMSV